MVGVGGAVGARMTSAQTAAKKELDDAVANVKMADEALRIKQAGQDKVFLGSMQKLIEGRFNQGAYDNLSKRYGLGNTFQAWMNSLTTGKFPDEVRQELVNAAYANLKAKQAGFDAAMGTGAQAQGGGGGTVKMRAPDGTVKPVPADQVEHYRSLGAVVVQ